MRSLVLTALLIGCGADPAQEPQQNGSTAAPVASEVAAQGDPTPQQPPTLQSLTAQTEADRPGCGPGNARQLVYVLENKAFYHCLQGQWQEIAIVGKDGSAGKDGANGKDGKDGVAGAAGKDGQTVTDGMWYDAVSGKYWIASTITRTYPQAQDGCTGDWRIPATAEIVAAFSRGLSRITTGSVFWDDQGHGVDANGQGIGGAAYALCVK